MKLAFRILLVMPFVAFGLLYCYVHNPDEDCIPILIELMLGGALYVFLLLSGILALAGTLRKRQSEKLKVEPVSFGLIVLTVLCMVFNGPVRGHTRGEKWILAETSVLAPRHSTLQLLLRRNGNFTVTESDIEYSCSISGSYISHGDTIILDKLVLRKANTGIATEYLIRSNDLLPLGGDSADKITFHINEFYK